MKTIYPTIIATILALTFSSCNKEKVSGVKENQNTTHSNQETKPLIVTTTTMINDMVKQIAGENFNIKGLMGPGVDPHLYKASPSDASALSKASLIVYNGLHLEGTMTERLEHLEEKNGRAFQLASALDKEALFYPEGESHADPHIWGNVTLWKQLPKFVGNKLAELDPDNAPQYQDNARKLEAKYQALDQWIKNQINKLPIKKRVLITSHDAFNYFGQAYEFKVYAPQGISTDSEPGLADIIATVDLIKKLEIKALFVETSVNTKAIERISKDSGTKIGGELFSDATGTPGETITIDGVEYDLGTYEGMTRHNVHTIVSALLEK